MRKRQFRKKIACSPGSIEFEQLPFPIVHYPNHYGAFFGFQEDNEEEIVFCSCCKKPIQNHIKFKFSAPLLPHHKREIISPREFPLNFIKNLNISNIKENEEIINNFIFEDKLCHECNKKIPNLRYCHEMYGGSFKQNFGWYIKKEAYSFGIYFDVHSSLLRIDTLFCPDDFFEILNEEPMGKSNIFPEILHFKIEDIINSKLKREALNYAENEARIKLGFKRIGESWTSETMLYNIICSIFPNKKIIRHHRPPFLEGLEFDIYIDHLNVGIEYQGIQHYKPIEHWGGIENYEKLKERDTRKREICARFRIPLIYFRYDEGLNTENVIEKLKKYI